MFYVICHVVTGYEMNMESDSETEVDSIREVKTEPVDSVSFPITIMEEYEREKMSRSPVIGPPAEDLLRFQMPQSHSLNLSKD